MLRDATPAAHRPRSLVNRGVCMETVPRRFTKSRTFRAVPIEEPQFPCSNPARGDVSPVTAGAQHRIVRSHHRAASASSSIRNSESPGSCGDSDTASLSRSAFVMSPRRYASTAM